MNTQVSRAGSHSTPEKYLGKQIVHSGIILMHADFLSTLVMPTIPRNKLAAGGRNGCRH